MDESLNNRNYSFISGDSVFILDLMRVIACEMVVVCHVIGFYFLFNPGVNKSGNFLLSFLSFISGILATNGVTLFFFISGIVISNSLYKKLTNDNYSFTNYFIDRFSRIYSGLIPCLLVILLIGFIINYINIDIYNMILNDYNSKLSLYGIIGSILMLQAFPILNPPIPPLAEVIWTLNMEWWLYLLFGWLALKYKKIINLDVFSILILGGFAFFPIYKFFAADHNLIVIWFSGVLITLILLNSRIFSTLSKNWEHLLNKKNLGYLIIVLSILIVLRVIRNYLRDYGNWDTSLQILIGLLILTLVLKYNGENKIKQNTVRKTINLMAKFSFTLYLVHQVLIVLIVAIIFNFNLNLHPALIGLLSIIFSNIAALLIAYPTEMQYKQLAKLIRSISKNSIKDVNDRSKTA